MIALLAILTPTVDATVLRDGRAWTGSLVEVWTLPWQPWEDDLPSPATPLPPYVMPSPREQRAILTIAAVQSDPWFYPSVPDVGDVRRDEFIYTEPPGTPWNVRARRYKRGRGVLASMNAYRCLSTCMAADRALALHHLDWRYHLVLTAESSARFRELLRDWFPILGTLVLNPSRPELRQPFYLVTIATADPDPARVTPWSARNIHGHVLLGGVSWDDVQPLRKAWGAPYITRVFHAFGILHYVHAQTKLPKAHMRDVFSYCPALLDVPIESDNLPAIESFYRATLYRRRQESARKAVRAGNRSLGKTGRRARARKAALASWTPEARARRATS